MVYKWKYYQYPVSANVVGKIIEKIEQENGSCTASALLDEARSEDSALHCLFEWNDTVAAEKYRHTQATQIITALVVTYEEDTDSPKTVRAFANVTDDNSKTGNFVTIARALSEKDSRNIVLQRALAELKAFKAKYSMLVELAELFDDINRLTA